MTNIRSSRWAGILTLFVAAATSASGATYTIGMTSALTFSPAALSIAQGDTVVWTNTSAIAHTSTSGTAPTADGHWASPSLAPGGTFSVTFTNLAPQAYAYFCAFHYAFGMTGTLTVTNESPLLLSLQSPAWTNGQFQFVVNGRAGTSYITEVSPDFTHWVALSTNLATSDHLTITDASATNHLGFYRVRVGP